MHLGGLSFCAELLTHWFRERRIVLIGGTKGKMRGFFPFKLLRVRMTSMKGMATGSGSFRA
jgi:hypothetical protein